MGVVNILTISVTYNESIVLVKIGWGWQCYWNGYSRWNRYLR